MRPIEKATTLSLILAAGLALLAYRFNWSILFSPASALAGMCGILIGFDTLENGKKSFIGRFSRSPENDMAAALYIAGGLLMFMGFALLFFAVWFLRQPASAEGFILELFHSTQGWGFLLLAIGFFTFVFGLARMVGRRAWQEQRHAATIDPSLNLIGLLYMAAGMLLLGGGIWLVLR
jgi:hypothetical protein